MHKIVSFSFGLLAVGALLMAGPVGATVVVPPPPPLPTSVDQCKHNGWKIFGDVFKNQGDCVSFVVTNGKNQPSGAGE